MVNATNAYHTANRKQLYFYILKNTLLDKNYKLEAARSDV